jgi:GT2 family glycosyltransferase
MTTAVIIVNWHGAADTEACITSLRAADPPPTSIIVVENGSTDGSLPRLQQWAQSQAIPLHTVSEDPATWPPPPPGGVVLIASTTNRGFSGGNNLGLAFAARDPRIHYFLLLNNDATVRADYFARLDDAIRARPDAALLSGTIYEMARPDVVWYAGGRVLPIRTVVALDYAVPSSPTPVATDFICGCTMLISAPALARLGPLPECYFPAYLEDTEYSYRAQAAGLTVLYAPAAVAYHKIGASTGVARLSPRTTYMLTRHRGFWARRNLRGGTRLAALLYLAVTKPARALVDVASGRPRVGWATLTGALAGLFSRSARVESRPIARPTALASRPSK